MEKENFERLRRKKEVNYDGVDTRTRKPIKYSGN